MLTDGTGRHNYREETGKPLATGSDRRKISLIENNAKQMSALPDRMKRRKIRLIE